jgi:hypothetical protein
VGTARKAFSRVQSYWESTATQPITDAVHILKISASVTGLKVNDQESQKLVTQFT